MVLTLKREFTGNNKVTCGSLWHKGMRLCSTREKSCNRLYPGFYNVRMRNISGYDAQMPALLLHKRQRNPLGLLRYGNGVCTLDDASIIVGQEHCRDLLVRSRATFADLVRQIEYECARKRPVALIVYDPE